MPEALSITAPFLVAVVLLWSAVGKLRDPGGAAEGFTALRVPGAFARPWMIGAHPWVEVALAALLLVGPNWLRVSAAVGVLGLMLAYLALVARAVRRGDDVDCACFGAWGPGRVTTRTVWRNAWLVVLAALSLWAALGGQSWLAEVAGSESGSWVVALGAALLTGGLVVAGQVGEAASESSRPAYAAGDEDLGDYLRVRTPAVPVRLADGTTRTLRQLSESRAQLLLFVSEGCSSCVAIIAAVPEWRTAMPQIDIRLVVHAAAPFSHLTSTDEPQTIHDSDAWLRETFDTRAMPSALLLGVDGHLAGGPVSGRDEVPAFVEEIGEALSVAPRLA